MLAATATAVPHAADVPPALKADSSLIMTKDGSAVCGTNGSITADALAAEFDGEVQIISPDGQRLTGEAAVPSGSNAVRGSASLPVIVAGDVNRDGKIAVGDAIDILKRVAGWDVDIDEAAAELTNSGKIGVSDAITVLKHVAGWNIKLGCVKVSVDTQPQTAQNERSDVSLWFEHSTDKLYKTDTTSSGNATYVIRSAKNEIEAAALYIANNSADAIDNVTASVTDFVNCYGDSVPSEILTYFYTRVNDNLYMPDALMPKDKYSAKVSANASQGFLVKAKVPADAAPGLYEAFVSICENGVEIKRAAVYLNVWDFALNDADACESSFGLSQTVVYSTHNMPEGDDGVLYSVYYNYFLENRINPAVLPYDITDDRANEYMNDPRVRSFLVGGKGYGGQYERTDAQIDAYYAKMKDNPEWLDKGYFYAVDEPISLEKWLEIDTYNTYMQNHFPGGMQVVPMECRSIYTPPVNAYDYLNNFVQIWCPKIYAYTPEKYRGTHERVEVFLTPEDTEKYGTYAENAARHAESGGKAWWYFARMPFQPYVTYHAEDAGVLPRLAEWQQYQCGVTGVLYYLVNDYGSTNPLYNFKSQTGDGWDVWGNGILCYPGYRYGINGPIGSIRVEFIRDGIEDYMYLKMLAREIGDAETNSYITRISRDLLDFDADSDKLMTVRNEIGDRLEQILADRAD